MSDIEDAFEPLPEEPQAEPQAAEPQQEAEQLAEPQAEPVAEPTEEPKVEPQAEPEEPKTVPLATFLSQRDELRDLKKQVETISHEQSAPKVEIPPRPDPLEDPDGATLWDQHMLHQRDLNRSQRMAEREHGKEFVQQAFQAAKAAGMAEQFAANQFGWEDMAEWHKTNVEAQEARSAMAEIGDPVAYKAKLKAELLAEIKAEMATEQITSVPSLASETSIGARTAPAAPAFTSLDDLLS